MKYFDISGAMCISDAVICNDTLFLKWGWLKSPKKYWKSEDTSCAGFGSLGSGGCLVHLTAGLNNTEKPCRPQQRSKTGFQTRKEPNHDIGMLESEKNFWISSDVFLFGEKLIFWWWGDS